MLGPLALSGTIDLKAYSSQYMRGDESNQRHQVPGYTVAGLAGSLSYSRYTFAVAVENVFNRSYDSYGIEAQNRLGTFGSNQPPNDSAPVEPVYTPGYARRMTLTVSTRLSLPPGLLIERARSSRCGSVEPATVRPREPR